MWRYYLDFFLFPVVAAAAALYDQAAWSLGWLAWAVFGTVLFTFVEYITHRWLLHGLFWHGTHERHHKHPSEYVIFPLWYTPAIFAGFFVVLPLPIFVGFVLGYCWFLTLHHALHHWSLRRATWLHGYALWHNLHHLHNNVNFGITTPIWDRLFGSHRTA